MGIASGIFVDFLANGTDVHAGVRVSLIVAKHLGNLLRVECHIDVEVGSYIPWRVVLPLGIGAYLQLQVLDVVNAGENNAVESGVHAHPVTFQILVAQHSEEIQEYLVVATLVHLVDSDHNWFGAGFAKICDSQRQIIYCRCAAALPDANQRLSLTTQAKMSRHQTLESGDKCRRTGKSLVAQTLKTQWDNHILFSEVAPNHIQSC